MSTRITPTINHSTNAVSAQIEPKTGCCSKPSNNLTEPPKNETLTFTAVTSDIAQAIAQLQLNLITLLQQLVLSHRAQMPCLHVALPEQWTKFWQPLQALAGIQAACPQLLHKVLLWQVLVCFQ